MVYPKLVAESKVESGIATVAGAEQEFNARDVDLALFHVALLCSVAGGWPVYGVTVNSGIDIGGNRRTEFLREMSEQPRRSREQRHTAQQFGWQANIGKRGTSHPCTIKWERAVKYFGMHSANRLEEPQM
jgi:hypothetical protein